MYYSKSDIKKCEKLEKIIAEESTTINNYWDKVKQLTKKITSDYSLSHWQVLAEKYEKEIRGV